MRRAATSWTSWRDAALEAVYPPQCALCGMPELPSMCAVCVGAFEPLPQELSRGGEATLDSWASLWRYTGRAAQAVQRLKYGRATSVAEPMGRMMAEAAERLGLADADAIVPVPIHWLRRCERGFNQSELLCEPMPEGRVRAELLERVRATRPQAGLDRAARIESLHGAFRASPDVRGLRVLLIDDVRTSGGTLEACASALREGGAVEVSALTFAAG